MSALPPRCQTLISCCPIFQKCEKLDPVFIILESFNSHILKNCFMDIRKISFFERVPPMVLFDGRSIHLPGFTGIYKAPANRICEDPVFSSSFEHNWNPVSSSKNFQRNFIGNTFKISLHATGHSCHLPKGEAMMS